MESEWSIVARVALAGLFGGIIGAEREYSGKAAGLRTHMFVAAASALLLSLGPIIVDQFGSYSRTDLVRTDPTRIIQAIITGISFLGAGTIIFHRQGRFVEGLTTAASILLVSAIGMSVALGAYIVAASVTGLGLVILAGIGFGETRLGSLRKRGGQDAEPPEAQDEEPPL